ncbi:CHASE2 domain-containing protein [Sphingomonas sp. CL5.1]|uniref:CHASE2 domain-containing protein n=1 Tax=Sphingomonas sp. CL5.1 TaxID=2653203 RepID=UPI001583D21B|nr:CHASE2 domain-containing protein [Sphingomonas sp. CL5.1]QKR99767.1 CHASE2 domain-containing protein [Sphingomonas sp. CL5.1]
MLYRRLILEWALVSLSAALVVAAATGSRVAAPIDHLLFDELTRLRPQAADDRILLVEIDDASLAALGRWPWPRSIHAKALEALARDRPAVIGYDILFLEPAADDAALEAALRHAFPVVLPVLPRRAPGEAGNGRPLPAIASAAAGLGSVDVTTDSDGVVRRFASGTGTPQMAELIARRIDPAAGRGRDAAADRLIAFVPPGSFRRIPFSSLADGSLPEVFARGKIVLVGGSAAGLGDHFLVPHSAGKLMSGVELQANVVNALLHDGFYRPLPPSWQLALGLLPVLLLLIAFLRFGPSTNLRLSILAAVSALALSTLLLVFGRLWFAPGASVVGLVLVYSLWAWRRLAAVSDFMGEEIRRLHAEPGLLPASPRPARRGDMVNIESNRLHDVIGQLRDLRAFVSEVLARLPDAVCVVAEDGEVVMGNLAADALFGRAVRGEALESLLATLGPGTIAPGAEFALRDGRTLVMTRAPVGGGTILRFIDISELKAASRAREEALQFLSHDMRAPHVAIIALLDRAADDAGRLAPVIRQHVEHGLKLADDFVELARLTGTAPQLGPVELCGVAVEAIGLVWPLSSARRITIEEVGLTGETWVTADHASLLRALMNLLDNAVKFAASGDRVTCRLETGGGKATVSVEGPGPDMPSERAADPFLAFAPGAAGGGIASRGLGLAFVRASIERQNGAVGYEARPDGIKAFSIVLPLAPADWPGSDSDGNPASAGG